MTIRAETMRPEHLPEAVRVHLDAFRGYMNAKFGPRYARAMLQWFMQAEKGIALVALDDGHVVGYVVGAPVGYGPAMTRALMPVAAFAALLRPWILFDRAILRRIAKRLRTVIPSGVEGSGRVARDVRPTRPDPSTSLGMTESTMSLVGIGVASSARGKGVGAILMSEFETRATAHGMDAMRLSVYDHNVAARKLYERSGWTLLHELTEGNALYFGRRLT